MIKCVVSDLDGTLLYKGKLSNNNYRAINLLKENGIKFAIATGRNIAELSILDLKDIVCPKVLVNGSLVLDENDEILSLINFKKDSFIKLINVLNEYKVGYVLYTKDQRYIVNKDIMLKSFENSMDVFGNDFFNSIKEFDKDVLNSVEFCKIEVLDGIRFEMLREIENKLGLINGLACTSSDPNNVEVISNLSSKYKGIKVLCAKYGFKEDEIAIFGDSNNDLSMFENIKESYAMGNGNDLIKSKAKYITDTCKNDGFYKSVLNIIENN